VIIITYNSSEVIEECMRSVFEKNKRRSFEIIVIDNHSKDGTAEKVRSAFPQSNVRVIKNNINIGFARAVNQGVRLARGKYILLLNPDAFLVSEEPIDEMIRFLETHPKVAAAGMGGIKLPQSGEMNKRGPLIVSSLIPSKLFPYRFFIYEILGRVAKIVLTLLIKSQSLPQQSTNKPNYTYWVSGSALLTPRSYLTAFPLDEHFFLYFEDIEWGERLGGKGYRFCYLPFVKYVHLWGGSMKEFHSKAWETAARLNLYRLLLMRNPFLAFIYRFHLLFFRIPLYLLVGFIYQLCCSKQKAYPFLKEAIDLFLWRYPFPR
jgi:GT2 family glycosyltransferase